MLLNGLTAEQFEKYGSDRTAWSKTRAKSGGRASELCSKLLRNRKQRSRSGRGRGALKAAQKEITRKWKQLESEKAEKRQALQRKYQYIQQEKMRLESEMQEKKRQLADLREPEHVTEEEKKKISWQIIAAICLLAVGMLLHSVYTLNSSHGKYFVSYLGNERRADTKSVRIKERETMESDYREKKQKLHWTLQRIGEEQKEKQVV